MSETSFVRKEILASQAPPLSEIGIVGWMRENLFSNWFNTLLTVLSTVSVYLVLAESIPWIFQSSWTATSLNECRENIAREYGEGVRGACWAVIRERYLQMLFGFYPSEQYWRPILAFVLMLAALSPILFPILPRALLLLSAIYPFAGYWLLWGGSIWGPASIVAGVAVGFFAMQFVRYRVAMIGVLALSIYLFFRLSGYLQIALPLGIEPIESAKMGGFLLSVTIGTTGIVLSLPIGIILALGRTSNLLIVKAICVGFIEFIRGVPLITLLFVASTLLNLFMPPGTNFDLILRVVIMVTMFASAYMAEVIRGGLAALPRGQYEAADALGLDYWKSIRLIIMPQALKISIPGIVSTFIGLFKDTTLVSIIGLLDPLGLTTSIRADSDWNGIVWELYGFVAVVFFIFCFAMSRYSMYLERKLETGNH
ncbi:MAG: amino acid ABC transporter permease [Albidovulum sp.]|nr:amino acid ABC transporter permease [Albidovulum sp.]